MFVIFNYSVKKKLEKKVIVFEENACCTFNELQLYRRPTIFFQTVSSKNNLKTLLNSCVNNFGNLGFCAFNLD